MCSKLTPQLPPVFAALRERKAEELAERMARWARKTGDGLWS